MKNKKKIELNNFAFGVLLTLSVVACCACFSMATAKRETTAIGGEVFMIALPLLVTQWKMWTIEQERKRQQKKIAQLQQALKKKKNSIYTL